jgi:hypothetical protein
MSVGSVLRSQWRLVRQGIIDEFGDDALDKTASENKGYPCQAHHCICCAVAQKNNKGKLAELLIAAGYDINNGGNNIFLPAKFGHMQLNSEQRHRGGHQVSYYAYVDDGLNPIYTDYKDTDPCNDPEAKKNILGDMMDLQASIKDDLESKGVWLYGWSERLYNEDYKEEGQGALLSANQQGSSVAGLAWADRYPSGKTRRKITHDGSLHSKWYSGKGFPLPSSTNS